MRESDMKSSRVLLILAGVLHIGVAEFQTVISFVLAWRAAFGAGEDRTLVFREK